MAFTPCYGSGRTLRCKRCPVIHCHSGHKGLVRAAVSWAQPGSHTGLWPAVLVRMCGRVLRLSFFTSREPWNSGEVLRWIPQVLAEQTCKGMWMMGEPVFKGDGWLILDKDKSYALDVTLGFTDQKTEREKGRSNRGVKYTSPIKISTRWYLLISWKLEGTSAQPGPGSSSHSCHHFFWLAS